ncbi:diguanylate phosphodiesterase [Sulfurimonas sp. HSL1-2]|uniref:diguanylate phosphodiesterase n=1 Tax=Thiomicrolovo zhangzhouensis TaxID=3131933 RepID=UPI0031F86680
MSQLIELIYCSAAAHPFSRAELAQLLAASRSNNEKIGVSGMLLYAEGSFFQVLEGEAPTVEALFETIRRDPRHNAVTLIIREPIARRAFEAWTMGYADITPDEVDKLLGASDFFAREASFTALGQDRAMKLLEAFKQGSWRARLSNTDEASAEVTLTAEDTPASQPALLEGLPPHPDYTFAFQPIIDVRDGTIFSYEALLRGVNNETAENVLSRVDADSLHRFDEESRILAIEMAARLGLPARLNLNVLPRSIGISPTAVASVRETARRCGLRMEQIVLEILEWEIIDDFEAFKSKLDPYRGFGMHFAIDDFGSGYAGLNLLAEFQPDLIKLDMELVRGIEHNGPRQAIVRGIIRTCFDLGIDIIAEGVETVGESRWLRGEGIVLYQGNLLAEPAFEALPTRFTIP